MLRCEPDADAAQTNAFENARGEPFLDLVDKYIVPVMGRTLYEGAARGVQLVSDPKYRHLTGVYVGDYLEVPMAFSKGVSADNARWLWCVTSLSSCAHPCAFNIQARVFALAGFGCDTVACVHRAAWFLMRIPSNCVRRAAIGSRSAPF